MWKYLGPLFCVSLKFLYVCLEEFSLPLFWVELVVERYIGGGGG